MLKRFSAFVKNATSRFRRIASSIGGHLAPEDLHGEAWLAAEEIAHKRGHSIDFANTADQELVLNRVYWNGKGQRDWRLASAYSIDDDREGATPWADRLAAPISTTPLEILLQREAIAISDSAIAASYSQAAAYNVALNNFNNDRPSLCVHLLITGGTLEHRMNRAFEVVRWQESIFDRYEVINSDFTPLAGRHRTPVVVADVVATNQAEFQF
jgi:hypothetical protein